MNIADILWKLQARRIISNVSSIFFVSILCDEKYTESRCKYSSDENLDLHIYLGEYTAFDNIIEVYNIIIELYGL